MTRKARDRLARRCPPSSSLPGAAPDLTAARTHGIIDALNSANVMTFADKAYKEAQGSIRTPFERYWQRPKLSRRPASVPATNADATPQT